ncbi:MAG: hypothetical protein P1S60_17135 [Anaerolineae bacterium]|nr:hypothetical protein [Anaerolineae bacterium]
MTDIDEQMESLLNQSTEYEQKARRRAFYTSLIPAALALILLMGTGLQIRSTNLAVTVAQGEVIHLQDEIRALQLKLDNSYDDLDAAQRSVVAVQTTLTETLRTLESITNDLVTSREQLAQTGNALEALQDGSGNLQNKVDLYSQEIEQLEQDIVDLQQSLDSVTGELGAVLANNRIQTSSDLASIAQAIAKNYPQAGALLETVSELQGSSWRVGGFAPDEGFDSPGFAAFVLEYNDRLTLDDPADRTNLPGLLPARTTTPQMGDIIFYEGGYAMFYFVDVNGVPFVVGMTSRGVLVLAPDFAPVIGYGMTE